MEISKVSSFDQNLSKRIINKTIPALKLKYKQNYLLLNFRSELINYSGDLMTPPDQRNKAKTTILSKKGGKTIKGGRRAGRNDDDDSSDDNDW